LFSHYEALIRNINSAIGETTADSCSTLRLFVKSGKKTCDDACISSVVEQESELLEVHGLDEVGIEPAPGDGHVARQPVWDLENEAPSDTTNPDLQNKATVAGDEPQVPDTPHVQDQVPTREPIARESQTSFRLPTRATSLC